MIDHALVDELKSGFDLPREALIRAAANPSAITQPVLDLLNKAAGGEELSDEEANLLSWGIHVVALARDHRAYAPLVRLLEDDAAGDIFGDLIAESMPKVIVGLFDGRRDLLFDLLAFRHVEPMTRWAVFDAVTYLTLDGHIPRAETEAFLARFADEAMAEPGDMAWAGWEDAIATLGLRSLVPRVKAAHKDGRSSGLSSWKEFSAELKRAESGSQEARSKTGHHYHDIGEVLADLNLVQELVDEEISDEEATSAMRAFEEIDLDDPEDEGPDDAAEESYELPEPAHNPLRHVGRNDPCPCGSGKKAKRCCLAA